MPHWFVAPQAGLSDTDLAALKSLLMSTYENVTLGSGHAPGNSFVIDIAGTEAEIRETVTAAQKEFGCRIYQGVALTD